MVGLAAGTCRDMRLHHLFASVVVRIVWQRRRNYSSIVFPQYLLHVFVFAVAMYGCTVVGLVARTTCRDMRLHCFFFLLLELCMVVGLAAAGTCGDMCLYHFCGSVAVRVVRVVQ